MKVLSALFISMRQENKRLWWSGCLSFKDYIHCDALLRQEKVSAADLAIINGYLDAGRKAWDDRDRYTNEYRKLDRPE